MPRILFTSPFKPFGIDNRYGRRENFPEIFHSRVTQVQGIFSYRAHFNVLGLHLIANNISARSKVLDYPTFKQFKKEIKKGYDYVGISSVTANFQKVRAMAEAVRKYSPRTKIIVGGYISHLDNIEDMVPVDHLCTGDGVSFMRELLGDPPEFEYKNPDIYSRAHSFLGVPLFGRKNPQIIVGLGCPYACEFCAPSHHFDRKYHRYFKTGRDLFNEMERMEKRFGSRAFGFHGDENFLVDIKRADELRECVIKSKKQYEIFHFGSADKAKEFGAERMAEMGTNLLWIGRESGLISMPKFEGVNLKEIVDDCHRHGIKVAISSMLMMEHHTPDNIWGDVEDHLSMRPEFSMFPFYSSVPGTPYFDRLKEENRILWGIPCEDWNGMGTPYSMHPNFSLLESKRIRRQIMEREYHVLGPSVMRVIRTDLEGYLHMKDSGNPALRRRSEYLAEKMSNYRALLWAMARMVPTFEMRDMVEDVLQNVERAFGPVTNWEKTQGLGLRVFGNKEKIKHRLFGDRVRIPTTVTRYPGRS